MPGSIRSLRARSLGPLGGAAMLLAFLALAATGFESISFGHQHLADGQALLHHHFYSGPHEHSCAEPDSDSDHDHDHGQEAPHHHGTPHKTATVAAAPALAQPVAFSVPAPSRPEIAPARPAEAPAPPARSIVRLLPPRAPPTLSSFRVS
jgi:hypothetical protein